MLTPLSVVLPQADIVIITAILQGAAGLNLSAQQMLTALQSQGENAPIFGALTKFIGFAEDIKYQTYDDGSGNMTLGIGLNLEDPNSAVLITALNNKFPNLNLVYETLRDNQHQPTTPLTDAQVNYLLLLTLTGSGSYIGKATQLVSQLGDLASKVFPANQLVALQSMAFNAPTLIGAGIVDALSHLAANGPLDVLIEIVEESNSKLSKGLQNRRLREAGLFYGDPTTVYTPFRQVSKILLENGGSSIVLNAPNIYPLPIGNEAQQFVGNASKIIVPGRDSKKLNVITYGSSTKDLIYGFNYGNQVVFGGDGDDAFAVSSSSQTQQFHYLAGNNGYDRYHFLSQPPSPATTASVIYDSDSVGEIWIDYTLIQGVVISGQLVVGNNKAYLLSRTANSQNSYTLTLTYASNTITLLNYKGGMFNIIWAQDPYILKIDPLGYIAALTNAHVVSSSGMVQ